MNTGETETVFVLLFSIIICLSYAYDASRSVSYRESEHP